MSKDLQHTISVMTTIMGDILEPTTPSHTDYNTASPASNFSSVISDNETENGYSDSFSLMEDSNAEHGEEIVKSESKDDLENNSIPRKRRYSKARTKNRSPALVEKLKKNRRNKANDRERNRMHDLNGALEDLRTILPTSTDENKLTKIETLRMAHNYIWTLSETLKLLDKVDTVSLEKFSNAVQQTAQIKCNQPSNRRHHPHQHPSQISPNIYQSVQHSAHVSHAIVKSEGGLYTSTHPNCQTVQPNLAFSSGNTTVTLVPRVGNRNRLIVNPTNQMSTVISANMDWNGYNCSVPRVSASPTQYSDTSDGYSYEYCQEC